MEQSNKKKSGIVLILGRPNVGKSTFVNNLIGQKVAITSPKPQTTRNQIRAQYEDERGRIIFIDTPGIFGRAHDALAKNINQATFSSLDTDVDVVMYMVDHTRKRDFEEAKVLGKVRQIQKPKILVINKTDKQKPSYLAQYRFLEDEFDYVFKVSALNRKTLLPLLEQIFSFLPQRDIPEEEATYPLLNMDANTFVAELIREKIFLKTHKEVPYSTSVVVDEITERKNNTMYIRARILTTDDRYKKMLIGKGGEQIKELGMMSRKELEVALNKKVYLELEVETEPHWQKVYFG